MNISTVTDSKYPEFRNDWNQAFDALDSPVFVMTPDHTVIGANRAALGVFNRTEATLIGQKCFTFYHCSDRPSTSCGLCNINESDHVLTFEAKVEAVNATFQVVGIPIRDDSGSVVRIVHIARNIQSLKETEIRLELALRSFRIISECNKAMIHSRDEHGLEKDLCQLIVNIGQYAFAEIVFSFGFGESRLVPVAFWGRNESDHANTMHFDLSDEQMICIMENRHVIVECTNSSHTLICLPLFNSDEFLGILSIFSDSESAFDTQEVSLLKELANDLSFGIAKLRTDKAHRKAQGELIASETKYRHLIEYANDAIFLARADDGIIFEANLKAEELTGVPKDKIVGMHLSQLHPPEEVTRYRKLFEEHIKTGKGIIEDVFVIHSDGGRIPVQISTNVMEIGGKTIIQGIFRDISTIKKHEKQIRQLEKLESLGTLAGGIAHDFNNILSPILGYSDLALTQVSVDSELHEWLAEIKSAGYRAKQLVSQILTFCRKDEQSIAVIQLHPILKEALKLLRSTIPSSVKVSETIDDDCGSVECDPTQIHQVLINLCINAVHAMNEKGHLSVSLTSVALTAANPLLKNEILSGDYLKLSVQDDGVGMDGKTLEKIFEPYFTTKAMHEGTGLGLSQVYGVIERYNGIIDVNSELGQGTVFDLYFPVKEPGADFDMNEPASAEAGTGRILLVDDEAVVINTVGKMLKSLGYEVTSFLSSKEAYFAFREMPGNFDLIITDMTMPDFNGAELAALIHAVREDIPIIVLSGYHSDSIASNSNDLNIRAVLRKPQNLCDLAAAVKAALLPPVT